MWITRKHYRKKYKFNVVRNETKHDYPAYSGSYTRSLETIQGILKKNKEAEIVFDIHRDAIGSGDTYGPTVKIGEEYAQELFDDPELSGYLKNMIEIQAQMKEHKKQNKHLKNLSYSVRNHRTKI